jgi:hypothetical protein
MDTLLDTTKNSLVNIFLTATMTRKIFIWYFIEYLLKGNRIPASVELTLRAVRQTVAKTISHNMVSMIRQQGRDQYGENADNSIISYLATSAMEMTSMSAIVLVMSFVTEEMLAAATNGCMSTTELMHDTDLDQLGHKITLTHSSEYVPDLGQQIAVTEPMETQKFAMAQIAATAHMEYVRFRLDGMLVRIRAAQDYLPVSTGGTRRHGYPTDWEDDRVVVNSEKVGTFAAEREKELEKLQVISDKVALLLLLVGIQRRHPNESNHTFHSATGAVAIEVTENAINLETNACMQLVKNLRAYQGIALSLIRMVVVASQRSHIWSRTQDYPAKMLERQASRDDLSRLESKYTTVLKVAQEASDTATKGELVLTDLTKEVDMLFLGWLATTDEPLLHLPNQLFTDSTEIGQRVINALTAQFATKPPADLFLNHMIDPMGESASHPKWAACMYPLKLTVPNLLVSDETFLHPLVAVYQYYYDQLCTTLGSSDDNNYTHFHALVELHAKLTMDQNSWGAMATEVNDGIQAKLTLSVQALARAHAGHQDVTAAYDRVMAATVQLESTLSGMDLLEMVQGTLSIPDSGVSGPPLNRLLGVHGVATMETIVATNAYGSVEVLKIRSFLETTEFETKITAPAAMPDNPKAVDIAHPMNLGYAVTMDKEGGKTMVRTNPSPIGYIALVRAGQVGVPDTTSFVTTVVGDTKAHSLPEEQRKYMSYFHLHGFLFEDLVAVNWTDVDVAAIVWLTADDLYGLQIAYETTTLFPEPFLQDVLGDDSDNTIVNRQSPVYKYIQTQEALSILRSTVEVAHQDVTDNTRELQIWNDNSECSRTVERLLDITLPAVRLRVLTYMQQYVQEAQTTEQASEWRRQQTTDQRILAETRFKTADTAIKEAHLYQQSQDSQSVPLILFDKMGTTCNRGTCQFSVTEFMDQFTSSNKHNFN